MLGLPAVHAAHADSQTIMVMSMHALHALVVTVHSQLDIMLFLTGFTVIANCLFSLQKKKKKESLCFSAIIVKAS